MKQKRFNKKLVIKKITISNLTKEEQLSIRGGDDGTIHGRTCDMYSTIAACQ
jgi:hypothetical protein